MQFLSQRMCSSYALRDGIRDKGKAGVLATATLHVKQLLPYQHKAGEACGDSRHEESI